MADEKRTLDYSDGDESSPAEERQGRYYREPPDVFPLAFVGVLAVAVLLVLCFMGYAWVRGLRGF